MGECASLASSSSSSAYVSFFSSFVSYFCFFVVVVVVKRLLLRDSVQMLEKMAHARGAADDRLREEAQKARLDQLKLPFLLG